MTVTFACAGCVPLDSQLDSQDGALTVEGFAILTEVVNMGVEA